MYRSARFQPAKSGFKTTRSVSRRFGSRLAKVTFGLLIGAALTFAVKGTVFSSMQSPGSRTPSALSIAVPYPFYFYRIISARYDSIVVYCVYGEICLPNRDSLQVTFKNKYPSPGLDTTAEAIYALSKTNPFPVNDTTELSVWRQLPIRRLNMSLPYTLPDTVAWIMELRNADDDALLAVLDSAGFLAGRGADSTEYPAMFGLANQCCWSYDLLHYFLKDYNITSVDSAYLQFRIRVFGDNDDCNVYDDYTYGYKFSNDFLASSANKRE